MKEKDLIALGFERVDVSEEQSGDQAFYYYVYGFGNGSLSLISPANDEIKNNKWSVALFEDETIEFNNSSDLMGLIDLINRNTSK